MIYNQRMANLRSFIVAGLLLTGWAPALAPARGTPASESAVSDSNKPPAPPEVVDYRYRVVASYPHDRRAFTQGLVYEDGFLYEGTGLYGQSILARRELKTGKTVKITQLARKHFGEGITLFGGQIIQLTWRNKTGFVYRKDTFTLLKEFTYPTEGWGITHDGRRLIYSDGTATLRFLDPNTFAETGRIEVRDQGRPVRGLNELEFIPDGPPAARSAGIGEGTSPGGKEQGPGDEAEGDRLEAGGACGLRLTVSGLIFANVWPTERIVIIDPQTGRVTGRLDLSTLHPRSDDSEDVLNGIAWIPESSHLLVTGKLWPKLYEIDLTPEPSVRPKQ